MEQPMQQPIVSGCETVSFVIHDLGFRMDICFCVILVKNSLATKAHELTEN